MHEVKPVDSLHLHLMLANVMLQITKKKSLLERSTKSKFSHSSTHFRLSWIWRLSTSSSHPHPLSQPLMNEFSYTIQWKDNELVKFSIYKCMERDGVTAPTFSPTPPCWLTYSDLVGVLGVREGQVDHVFLSPRLVQAGFRVLPSLQHKLHCLLVSWCGGHMGHFCQLPLEADEDEVWFSYMLATL